MLRRGLRRRCRAVLHAAAGRGRGAERRELQRAARFFYLQQHAFGGKVDGQSWGTATTAPPLNLLRIEENLSAAHLRLSGVYIENLDWYKCMERYDRPHTLFYLDPPYWETAGYGVEFEFAQYEKMAELMARLKGKAILSLNDHPDIRRVYARFQMDTTGIQSSQMDLEKAAAARTGPAQWKR